VSQNKNKICQIFIFDFQCVAINIKRFIKDLYLIDLVYNQIWLNLPLWWSVFPMDDGHLSYFKIKKSLKKNTMVCVCIGKKMWKDEGIDGEL